MKILTKSVMGTAALCAGLLLSSQTFAYPVCQFLAGKCQTVGVSNGCSPAKKPWVTLYFTNVVPCGKGVNKVYGYTVVNGCSYPMYNSYCIDKGCGYCTPWKLCINSCAVKLHACGVADKTYRNCEFGAVMARILGYKKCAANYGCCRTGCGNGYYGYGGYSNGYYGY